MLATAIAHAAPAHATTSAAPAARQTKAMVPSAWRDVQLASQRIADSLKLVHEKVSLTRRMLHAGESVYEAGERFDCLYVVNSGFFKLVNLSADGREQVVGLQFKGDWLGFDGIAGGRYGCDAIAMDTGEVWMIRYDTLLSACAEHPPLMGVVHSAMSREMTRDRDSLLSICTLPADARVAEFLCNWAESLSERGLRTDQITLRMTRAEIGNYLGMKLETVSRALSRLARDNIIQFSENGRRDIRIADVAVLAGFVQRSLSPDTTTLQ